MRGNIEGVLRSVIGVILLAVSGWLGGEMVHVHGVGVDDEADASRATRERAQSEHWNEGAAQR